MNKFAKGSLAAGAGLVLLLGGAGTLAYWNDSAELTGGTINAGTLTLKAADQGWSNEIETWVPGDSSSYLTTLTVTASGDNIAGVVTMDEESIKYSDGDAGAFLVDFEPEIDATEVGGATYDPSTETFTFSGPGTYTIPVKVTVELPFGSEADNDSQAATVNFDEVNFTATQTPAADNA